MMDNHINDIFYKVNNLNFKKKKEIIKHSYNICFDWWVDKLDCSESWSRQKVDMTFDEIMSKFTNDSLFVIIHRRGYESWKKSEIYKWKGEIGFCTMGDPSWYLWIYITENNLVELINKYNLKEKQS